MRESDLLVDPLLEELEEGFDGLQVTAIGGGHGLAAALEATLDYAEIINAVVGVSDDGGSSGRLAPELAIPPPGDIRRALLALAPQPSLWRDLIEFRFEDADVAGHSLGNLILAAMTDLGGDFADAVNTVGRMIGARGAVIPVADVPLELEAVVDGVDIRGQVAIATSRGVISDVRVVPSDTPARRAALDAVAAADQIVLGPGSLYTSVIAPLRVGRMAEEINASDAPLVYVCNLITQDGETLGMSGLDHVEALVGVAGIRAPDVIVVHDGPLGVPHGLAAVTIDRDEAAQAGMRVERGHIADSEASWPAHDPARLGAVLRRLA